jgi:hypothetical protein
MRLAPAVVCIPLLLRAGLAAAQGTCTPPTNSHEAQMFAAYSVPLAYAFAGTSAPLSSGGMRLLLEGTYLPDIAEDIRTPTICRPGKGPENTDFLFAYPRPRAVVGLPGGLRLEASWIPPVRLNQVKSNLMGLSLDRGVPVGPRGAALVLRAHATFGSIRAPITCDEEDLADPSSECFQGTKSDDHYHPNIFGLEGIFAWSLGGGRARPFIGAGINILHPRFQVNFTNRFGSTDSTRVEVDMTRGALFGGATWAAAGGFGLTGEIYGAPGDAVTGRLVASYALR